MNAWDILCYLLLFDKSSFIQSNYLETLSRFQSSYEMLMKQLGVDNLQWNKLIKQILKKTFRYHGG